MAACPSATESWSAFEHGNSLRTAVQGLLYQEGDDENQIDAVLANPRATRAALAKMLLRFAAA